MNKTIRYVLFALELTGRGVPKWYCKGCGDPYIREPGRQRYCTPECQKRTWDRANRSSLSRMSCICR